MAVDPYVKSGGIIPRKFGGITRDIGGLAKAIKRVKAGDTSGLGNQGGNQGGGGGGAVVAPSALDSLPKTPEIQALIAKGLLRADMAPEQILAIVGMAGQVAGVPIDIAALKAQLAQDYASTTGNILGMGADWMEQMFGANMPDGNAAAYAADPMFAQYAAGLGQQEATAGLNQATDQAWFDKQQQAMTDYYNGLMQSIAMGVGTEETGGGGGGGGYGGGRRGYGGGGGGGSGGDGDWGYTDPTVKSSQKEQIVDRTKFTESARYPDFQDNTMLAAIAQYGEDSPEVQYLQDQLDTGHTPPNVLEQLVKDQLAAQGTIDVQNTADENNKTWTRAAPAQFEGLRSEYERLTGNTLGDTTPEDAFQWQTEGENTDINLAQIAPGTPGAEIIALMSQAYDPSNPNALYGYAGGSNENIDLAADFFNRVLNAGAERRDTKAQSGAQTIVAALQNRLNPVNGKGSTLGAVGGPSAGVAGGGMSTTQANPYATGAPGAYSPLSSANSGSISGSGPATSQLTSETVENGTYSPPLNQTDQAANVSPYDDSMGDPLRRYYEAMNNGPAPTSVYGQPQGKDWWSTALAHALGTNPPTGGPNPSDSLDSRPSIISDPALVDPAYSGAQGAAIAELLAETGQTNGITPAGAGIDELPPEIIAAAAQNSNGPPGISDINIVLSQAGFPTLDSTGHLTGPIREPFEPTGSYGPSGNTRPMIGGNALLGMPAQSDFGKGDFTKPGGNSAIRQAAMSKLAGQSSPESSAAISELAQVMDFLSDVHGASSEGPITGNTVYDKIIGNEVLTPQTTDQYGRVVPTKIGRPDVMEGMRSVSNAMLNEEKGNWQNPFEPFVPEEGKYWRESGITPEALADAQMVVKMAPWARDVVRPMDTYAGLAPYSLDVSNQGTTTQENVMSQKTENPLIIAGTGAGDLNNLGAPFDPITTEYDEFGMPDYDEEPIFDTEYQGAPPNTFGGGGGVLGGLKSMAIRRIAGPERVKPAVRAPLTSRKSQLKAGTGRTYTKGSGTKKSYVTNTKTPYIPKNKKKYSKW